MKDFSQFGEFPIIARAVAAIEKNGFQVSRVAVEFGSGDGYALSNIRGLMEGGWQGYQLEKEDSTNPLVIKRDITAENVSAVLSGLSEFEIGVISIDVDGCDWWIWKAMTFNPAIVCIEYNPQLEGHKTIRYDPGHRWTGTDSHFGASFLAIMKLGHQKGYKAIAKTPCNIVFARADLWPDPEPLLKHDPVAVWTESEKEWQEV